MENELSLDLDNIELQAEEKLKVKNRFERLSEKVILTSKEKDELAKAKAELETKYAAIEKERDFFKDFSASSAKYPEANAYQDKILEKVRLGYSPEDATVSVLAKEGKLGSVATPTQAPSPEGGSASTVIEGEKDYKDMTPTEKRNVLTELDKQGGLEHALRGRA